MKFSSMTDMSEKAVINLCNGAKLGCPEDFEFDVCSGKIVAIVVAGEGGAFGFGKRDEFIIPWDKLECIGEDAILVRLEPQELQCCLREQRKKKQPKPKM